jgi:hypothetical protein
VGYCCFSHPTIVDSRQLFPLLLRGLELPDPALRVNVVESLVAIVESEGESHGVETIRSHLGTLVVVMLRNTRGEQIQHSVVVSGVLLTEAIRFARP